MARRWFRTTDPDGSRARNHATRDDVSPSIAVPVPGGEGHNDQVRTRARRRPRPASTCGLRPLAMRSRRGRGSRGMEMRGRGGPVAACTFGCARSVSYRTPSCNRCPTRQLRVRPRSLPLRDVVCAAPPSRHLGSRRAYVTALLRECVEQAALDAAGPGPVRAALSGAGRPGTVILP